MPSVSGAQHRFFEMIDHDPGAAKRTGVPKSVAHEFVEADKGRHFDARADGGPVRPAFSSGGVPALPSRPGFQYGGMLGIPMSMADPWWTRQEMRGETMHPPGLVSGMTGGRADRVPTAVMANSFVIPADVVSGLGAGNTLSGARVLDDIFKSGPHGTEVQKPRRGDTIPRPPRENPDELERMENTPPGPFSTAGLKLGGPPPPPRLNALVYHEPKFSMPKAPHGFDTGGLIHHHGQPLLSTHHPESVPVLLSDGEYLVSPDAVQATGSGDYDRGHRILEHFVKQRRQKHIKTLSKLPGPKRD